jgi:branched-subunit amino acid aminotransferase/4-amino-4-deoxychorismate lyase
MVQPPQPDQSLGVFETMLVFRKRPIEILAHLERLLSSLQELYDATLPERAEALIQRDAQRYEIGRLRLTASISPTGIQLEVTATEIDPVIVFPSTEHGLHLRTVVVDGWSGAHKWVDRRLLDALDKSTAPATALLVDVDGTVLETTRANVFAVFPNGTLATPRADGRILPGVARRRVLEKARESGLKVVERDISRADLMHAGMVFTTGSVRGVEPVRSIDGFEHSGGEPAVAAVTTRLRTSWLGQEQLMIRRSAV